jgi:hypothetical protein
MSRFLVDVDLVHEELAQPMPSSSCFFRNPRRSSGSVPTRWLRQGARSAKPADRDREFSSSHHDVHAVLLLVNDDRRDLGGRQRVDDGFPGPPEQDDVDARRRARW